tara:strand:- start:763 stop:1221 length:459 start_codon:yes stop_codon:yes gene_type:complete
MKNFKNIYIAVFFVLFTSCGYTPLINSVNNDFNIESIAFKGDRQINNYISRTLKKYQNKKDFEKNYKIEIRSEYQKNITNKDESGNPKNYSVKAMTSIILVNGDSEVTQNFERSLTFSALSKKIDENEIEKKYKKNISNLIAEDIIFFLRNQ